MSRTKKIIFSIPATKLEHCPFLILIAGLLSGNVHLKSSSEIFQLVPFRVQHPLVDLSKGPALPDSVVSNGIRVLFRVEADGRDFYICQAGEGLSEIVNTVILLFFHHVLLLAQVKQDDKRRGNLEARKKTHQHGPDSSFVPELDLESR